MGRKLRKWVLAAGLWAVSSLTAQALRAATGEDLPKQGTVREEQGFKLKKEHDSLYWLNDWRLPYPVYQFQTGDVDGDGRADAMVGVVKSTRFYPEKARRLFIFKQVISTAAHSKGQVKARPLWLGSEAGRHPRGLPLRGASRGRLDGQDPCPGIDHRLALRGDRLQMGELRHEVRPLSDQRSRQTNSNKNL